MKNVLLVAILFTVQTAAAQEQWAVRSASPIPMRESNAITSTIITNLENGQIVEVISSEFGWSHVRLADGQTGYVSTPLLVRYTPPANSAPPPAARPTAAASSAAVAVDVAPTASAQPKPAPRAASQGAAEFQKVKMVVQTGDKSAETDVALRFEQDRLVVRSQKGGSELKAFPYSDIKSADYSYSKHPRWKSGAALAVAIGVFAIPMFFMKGKKHWLTVQTEKDFAMLHLDKGNYAIILPTFETRTGIKVDTVGEKQ